MVSIYRFSSRLASVDDSPGPLSVLIFASVTLFSGTTRIIIPPRLLGSRLNTVRIMSMFWRGCRCRGARRAKRGRPSAGGTSRRSVPTPSDHHRMGRVYVRISEAHAALGAAGRRPGGTSRRYVPTLPCRNGETPNSRGKSDVSGLSLGVRRSLFAVGCSAIATIVWAVCMCESPWRTPRLARPARARFRQKRATAEAGYSRNGLLIGCACQVRAFPKRHWSFRVLRGDNCSLRVSFLRIVTIARRLSPPPSGRRRRRM